MYRIGDALNFIRYQNRNIIPSKILCIGRNYADHIHELNNDMPDEPVIFIKPNSAISGEIKFCDDLHYEGELCFLIENGSYAAVGFGIDFTRRNLQSELKQKGLPWERAKAFNASAVFSDFIPLPENITQLGITLRVNNELRQKGGYELMTYKPETCLAAIKRDFALEDGDIVMTGTPKGVGAVALGDQLLARVTYAEQTLLEARWRVNRRS